MIPFNWSGSIIKNFIKSEYFYLICDKLNVSVNCLPFSECTINNSVLCLENIINIFDRNMGIDNYVVLNNLKLLYWKLTNRDNLNEYFHKKYSIYKEKIDFIKAGYDIKIALKD